VLRLDYGYDITLCPKNHIYSKDVPSERLYDGYVKVYCLGKEVEILESPTTVFGEDVLPGFELNLNKVW
jgi:hypothetical protein